MLKSAMLGVLFVAGVIGAAYAGRATAPPPIFFQKAHLLVVTMKTGEPRVMGIWATRPECDIQIKKEIELLAVYEAASQFDKEKWVCQLVLLPTRHDG